LDRFKTAAMNRIEMTLTTIYDDDDDSEDCTMIMTLTMTDDYG